MNAVDFIREQVKIFEAEFYKKENVAYYFAFGNVIKKYVLLSKKNFDVLRKCDGFKLIADPDKGRVFVQGEIDDIKIAVAWSEIDTEFYLPGQLKNDFEIAIGIEAGVIGTTSYVEKDLSIFIEEQRITLNSKRLLEI